MELDPVPTEIGYTAYRTNLNKLRRFERPPILEPKHWWHKVPLRRKNTYRRLALETLGANNLISDHTIVRAHDRANPLMIKMFTSSNYGKRISKPWIPKPHARIGTHLDGSWKCRRPWRTIQRCGSPCGTWIRPPTSSEECCCSTTGGARRRRMRRAESGKKFILVLTDRGKSGSGSNADPYI